MSKLSCTQCALLVLSVSAAFIAGAASPGAEHAAGVFEVKIQPFAEDKTQDQSIAKMSLDKQYHGDLEATGKGAMLATGSATGNGAYVALEVVSGKLKGHEGTFVLEHTGLATQGNAQLNVVVVPNSGTGDLATLSGKMTIKIANGMHSYDFEYSLGTGH